MLSREEADALVASLPPLAGITADSRDVSNDLAFAAYPGTSRDGRAFIVDALARSAAAIVYEARDFEWDDAWHAPHVGVRDLKSSIGPIASSVYGHPSQALWMVGVTGTNGKTSCAWWIAHTLSDCGRRTALAGTLGSGFVDALAASSNTTPDACVLQRSLAQWRRAGAEAVAMEVSSHGLEQRRVDGVAFDVALFTNLTRDHLDYHATMDAYGAAKARLFAWPGLRSAVINEADAFGRELVRRTRARGTRVITYGAGDSDIAATRVDMTGAAMALQLRTPHGAGSLCVPLAGAFNVHNVCGVLGVLLASDIALADALRALSRITPPAGLGWLVTNPPYGVRVGEVDRLRNLYAQLGNVARQSCAGWTLALLSANARLDAQLGMDLEVVLRTRNGGIPVHLARGIVPYGAVSASRSADGRASAPPT